MSDAAQTTETTQQATTTTTEQTTEQVEQQPTTEQTTEQEQSLVNQTEEKGPEPFDPEKLTLPEGFEKNEHFTAFNEWAKENNVSLPGAQKLIDLYSESAKASAAANAKAWEEQNAKWQNEVKEDKEVGGANLQGVLQTISKVVDNPDLTDPKFREALDFTGAGNHPAVVRTLARWAKALSEGTAVAGAPPGNQGQRPPLAVSIYGPNGPRTGNPRMET